MFDEVNNQSTPVAPASQATDGPVQDIFASVESPAPSQSSSQPNSSQPFMPAGLPVTAQPVSQMVPKSGFNAKWILIILVVLILAGAAALVYLQYFKKTPPPIITPEAINVISETEVTTTEPIATATDEAIIDTTSTDNSINVEMDTVNVVGDEIGVTEPDQPVVADNPIPEANPNLDSDQDGLTDAEELNIYQTNPLQADSDGDGYTDGDEVRAGYNPLGSGKLAQ